MIEYSDFFHLVTVDIICSSVSALELKAYKAASCVLQNYNIKPAVNIITNKQAKKKQQQKSYIVSQWC